MFNITEGTEVLLKTGEYLTVLSGFSSWRGQRWTGKGWNSGRDIQKEFGEEDVRAVLSEGRGTAPGSSRDSEPTLF